MRMMRVAAVVAMSLCLATTTSASNWTGGDGDWGLGTNWSDGVPDGTDAYIGSGQIVTLDTNEPDITTLDVAWFSTLNIEPGAGLTAGGDARVASGGNDTGIVAQSGGVVSLNSNLIVGAAAGGIASWTMTNNGTLAVGTDLTVGGLGQGTFELGGTGTLTVGGNIDIDASSGSGTMKVSGGTLGQLAGGGDPAILADLNVSGSGSLVVKGNVPVIDVASYEQASGASLDLVLDNGGIATINVHGTMTLSGSLNVTKADGAIVPDAIYDIIVGQGGITGGFNALDLPPGVGLSYDNESSTVKLYVGVAPPAMDVTVIDSFDQGTHQAVYSGVNVSSYVGPGPIGGERVLRAYNNHTNNSSRVTVDATAGTCEFWGDTNAANRGVNWGTTNSDGNGINGSGSTELNLDLMSATALEIDFLSNTGFDYAQLYPVVYLRTNNGEGTQTDFSFGLNLNMSTDPFSVSIPMTAFTFDSNPMTAADLEDVDGIRLYSYQNGTLVIDELRIVSPASADPGGEVPEPAGLGLIGLSLLALKKRRR